MIITPRPGTLVDVMALMGRVPGRHARAMAVQGFKSEIIAIDDAAGLACLLGFYPLKRRGGVDRYELWMLTRPSGASPDVIRAVIRLARSTFLMRAHSGPVAVVATVQPGWQPGRRLVGFLGMRRWPSRDRLERYGWKHGKYGLKSIRRGERQAESGDGASAVATASEPGQPAERLE